MKTLLDDAAAHATTDLSIDLAAVRERAARDRTQRVHRRGRAVAVLAVAATVALIAVLFPAGSAVRGSVLPADEPAPLPAVTGIPSGWYLPPVWTPPVTRHPMTAAVMVLDADLEYGPVTRRHDVRGPVLVSADARTYATLPSWSDFDGGLTLSPDGRKVAWWTDGHADAPPVVHQLTLATGHGVDTEGSWGSRAVSLAWQNGSLLWTEADQAVAAQRSTVRIGADGATTPSEMCAPAPGVAPSGQLGHAAGVRTGSAWTVGIRSGPADQASCEGLVIGRPDKDFAVESTEPVTDVTVLAWTAGGIVIRVASSGAERGNGTHYSIRVADPETGAMRVISRPRESARSYPIAVASGLIASPDPIAAPPPVFAGRDRSHLVWMAAFAWSGYRNLILFAAFVLAAGVVALTTTIVRRRRARRPGPDDGPDDGPGDESPDPTL